MGIFEDIAHQTVPHSHAVLEIFGLKNNVIELFANLDLDLLDALGESDPIELIADDEHIHPAVGTIDKEPGKHNAFQLASPTDLLDDVIMTDGDGVSEQLAHLLEVGECFIEMILLAITASFLFDKADLCLLYTSPSPRD